MPRLSAPGLSGVLAQDKGQGDEGAAIRGPGKQALANRQYRGPHSSSTGAGRAFFGRHGTGAAQSAGRTAVVLRAKGERVSLALQKRAGPGQPLRKMKRRRSAAAKIGQHGKGAALTLVKSRAGALAARPVAGRLFPGAGSKFMINAPEIACRFQVRDNPPEDAINFCPGKTPGGARLRSLARTFPEIRQYLPMIEDNGRRQVVKLVKAALAASSPAFRARRDLARGPQRPPRSCYAGAGRVRALNTRQAGRSSSTKQACFLRLRARPRIRPVRLRQYNRRAGAKPCGSLARLSIMTTPSMGS